jgi:phenylacetate-CoA ligase
LTKDIIRKEKQNLIAADIKKLYLNSSGGSTGEPLNFYQDKNYKQHSYATMLLIQKMCG